MKPGARCALQMLACCFVLPGLALHAQNPAPLPSPNLSIYNRGSVTAIARSADGSVFVGGVFTSVYDPASQTTFNRNFLAKFSATGALDLAWNPSPNNAIEEIEVDASGAVYVSGPFNTIGGQSRLALAKLSGTGTGAADPVWNPSPSGNVFAFEVDSNFLYCGGDFSTIGGQPRNNIARISLTGAGAADNSWVPTPNSTIYSIESGPSGVLYIGGTFTSVGGQARFGLARLSTSFSAPDAGWNPAANGFTFALAVEPGGSVYAAGSFTSIGGQLRNGIAKLSGAVTASADPSWNPSGGGLVDALAADSTGGVYVGGSFASIGGLPRARIAKLSSTGAGSADPGWNPSANSGVTILETDPSGVLLAGGNFSVLGGQLAMGFARISPAGSLSTSPLVQVKGEVSAVAVAPDGSAYIGGRFSRVDASSRQNVFKLRVDRTVDPDWNPSPDGPIDKLQVDGSGGVFASGSFSSVGGQARSGIAKLSGTGAGAADPIWNPIVGDSVLALAVDSAGAVYIGGPFATVGGQPRARIAKLSGTGAGAIDSAWNPSANDTVTALAASSSGVVYAGGYFTTIGGQSRNRIAKLSATGTGAADPTWNPSANNAVFTLAVDSGGALYAGGNFTNIGGQARGNIAKLSGIGTGAADPAWNPSANTTVRSIALDPTGAVYAAGSFINMGGLTRNYIAKISGSGVGAVDPTWNPNSVGGTVSNIAIDTGAAILVGGDFSQIGGTPRELVAVLPLVSEVVFRNGFESP